MCAEACCAMKAWMERCADREKHGRSQRAWIERCADRKKNGRAYLRIVEFRTVRRDDEVSSDARCLISVLHPRPVVQLLGPHKLKHLYAPACVGVHLV
jgi:hypothetical protein